MAIKQIAGFIFIFAGAVATYVPEILTRGRAKLTGGELGERYPERAWIRYVYPSLYMLIFFGAAFLFFMSFSRSEMLIFSNENWFFVIGGVLGSIPLLNGVFALLTGVIPLNRRQNLYVVDEEIQHQVGFLLVGVGVFFIAISAMVIFFWK